MENNKLQLIGNTTSPFVRKCLLSLRALNIEKQTTFTKEGLVKHLDLVKKYNPLHKIPVLIDKRYGAEEVIFDSNVIIGYLQFKANSNFIMPPFPERLDVMLMAEVSNDSLASTVSSFYEKSRPEDKRSLEWISKMEGKIISALDFVENNIDRGKTFEFTNIHDANLAVISLTCLCDYVALRSPNIDIYSTRPKVKYVVDKLNSDAFVASTKPA